MERNRYLLSGQVSIDKLFIKKEEKYKNEIYG